MEILVGKNAGFCGGVLNSVLKATNLIGEHKDIYCLGELVHNKQVIDRLEEKGLIFIESLEEVKDNSNVIIRAHGISKEIYEDAKKKNINIFDLTCPKVLKIHDQAEEYSSLGYFIVLVAHRLHPEVIGTISFCGKNSLIIESIEEVDEAVEQIKRSNINNIVIIAQTTFSMDLFNKITEELKKRLNDKDVLINNTICNATEIRQNEIKELAKEVDAMIIIGGKNSSNTKKLHDISKNICENTFLVEIVDDLINDFSIYDRVGVMAGASTPKDSIEEVVKYLDSIKSC